MEVTEYQEKTTDMPQVTDKLYHITEYTSPWAGFEITNLVVIDTDCIGNFDSNYHTISTTMAPYQRRKVSGHINLYYVIDFAFFFSLFPLEFATAKHIPLNLRLTIVDMATHT